MKKPKEFWIMSGAAFAIDGEKIHLALPKPPGPDSSQVVHVREVVAGDYIPRCAQCEKVQKTFKEIAKELLVKIKAGW